MFCVHNACMNYYVIIIRSLVTCAVSGAIVLHFPLAHCGQKQAI